MSERSASNHLSALLQQWYPNRDQLDWVMGTIIDTAGSAYRKAGARMFFNSDGQQLGLLSGGCLESDLLRQARMVMHSGRSKTVTYDMQDEDDIAWQLGIGCGGKVVIQLDQINAENQYLGLGKVYQVLQQGHSRWHWLWLKGPASTGLEQANENSHNTAGLTPADVAWRVTDAAPGNLGTAAGQTSPHQSAVTRGVYQQRHWLVSRLFPAPSLLVFGGDLDARPLVAMAAQLGWQITLIDHRPAYARAQYFTDATNIIKKPADSLANSELMRQADAAVVMTHNLEMDAAALSLLAKSKSAASYVGILGPIARRDRLLKTAGLSLANLPGQVSGPAGLDLGGELPESIALAILAEAHACLYQASGAGHYQGSSAEQSLAKVEAL